MADSIKETLRIISTEAARQGVKFEIARKGRKHLIYHLGNSVVLPVPHSKVPSRIMFEMFKACEPELGYRWWKPEDQRQEQPRDLPCAVARGYRGPRGKHAPA